MSLANIAWKAAAATATVCAWPIKEAWSRMGWKSRSLASLFTATALGYSSCYGLVALGDAYSFSAGHRNHLVITKVTEKGTLLCSTVEIEAATKNFTRSGDSTTNTFRASVRSFAGRTNRELIEKINTLSNAGKTVSISYEQSRLPENWYADMRNGTEDHSKVLGGMVSCVQKSSYNVTGVDEMAPQAQGREEDTVVPPASEKTGKQTPASVPTQKAPSVTPAPGQK